ncbi:MAG TPA: hypothetical protein VKF38_15190 [Anaerolineaceae bacterium]|nr:hypothetical protein [Anaerolineaceae bacterium]
MLFQKLTDQFQYIGLNTSFVAALQRIIIIISFILILCACSVKIKPVINATPTSVVTLTPQVSGILKPGVFNSTRIPADNCLLGTTNTIDVQDLQGDLVSWSPVQNVIAFVSPSAGSSWSWYLGDLVTISNLSTVKTYSVTNGGVFGDITWSPDGKSIAFIARRFSDDTYTAMALQTDTGQLTDLFPDKEAHTDSLTSPKGIDSWIDNTNLVVSSSCDGDCVQLIKVNTLNGSKEAYSPGTIRKKDDHSLDITNIEPTIIPTSYPTMTDPNWAPDSNKNELIYFDENGNAQFISGSSTPVPLGVGYYRNGEIKWSYDSKYVAIRLDDNLYFYQADCLNNQK